MNTDAPKRSLKVRWLARRNAIFADPRFHHCVARLPLISRIARNRAATAFDLVAGFSYTQILRAFVESGLFTALSDGPHCHANLAEAIGLRDEATLTLLRAGRALKLSEEAEPDGWMLGETGAVLAANEGAQAMVRHNHLLYRDLTDPMELLRKNRTTPTELSRYWSYAGALHGAAERGQETTEYSELMAASQHLVADQVLASFRFQSDASLLDVGGGYGAFLKRIARAHTGLRLGLFDLPEVITEGGHSLADSIGPGRLSLHPGNFFEDPIPTGYDIVSLSRILHDHDDEAAAKLLSNIRRSMKPGTRLLIAEPMARTKGAEGMGEAFFGMYLWAMGSGRPRSEEEIIGMTRAAGFSRAQSVTTAQPINASMIVAIA